jgi:hypothetical protein
VAPAAPPAAASIDAAQQQRDRDVAFADSIRNVVMREVLDSVMRIREPAGGRGRRPGFPTGADFQQLDRLIRDSLPRVYQFNAPDSARSRQEVITWLSPQAYRERAANMGPPRRVFIAIPRVGRTNPAARDAAMALRDSIALALKHDPRFVPVFGDSTVMTSSSGRISEQEAQKLNVDMVLSVAAMSLGNGLAQWQVTARDLTAHASFQQRVIPMTVRLDSLTKGADSLVARAMEQLHTMDRAPRKSQGAANVTVVKDSAKRE